MKRILLFALGVVLALASFAVPTSAQTIPGGGGGSGTAPCSAFGTTTGTCIQGAGALGTPSSGTATNLTGTAAGLTSGSVTTNANLTGPITSTGNATAVGAQTGTGSTFVMSASPSVANPTLTGSVTATGLITNSDLANAAATVNGQTCTLGSTCTVPAAAGTLTGTALPSPIVTAPGLSSTIGGQAIVPGGATANQGMGSKIQLSTGTTTTNDCVKFDATGNTVDNGAACGSGGSTTPCTTTALSLQYNASGSFGCISGAISNGTTTQFTDGDLLIENSAVTGGSAIHAPATTGHTDFTLPATSDTLLGVTATQTPTNKTISGATNTITNIGNGSLTNSSITIGGQATALGGSTTNQGNGTKLQLSTGTTTSGHCVQYDANGNTIDAGAVCGTGGGVTSVATGSGLTGGTITTTGTLSANIPVNAQTGTTYTVLSTDAFKLVTYNNASAIAVTLPVATTSGFGSGQMFYQQNIGAGTVTITPTTSTINGTSSLVMKPNTGCFIDSDGTNYQVVACPALVPQTITLSPGLTTTLGTNNASPVTAANNNIASQIWPTAYSSAHTVLATEMGGLLVATGGSSVAFTIPALNTAGFQQGQTVCFVAQGTGGFTLTSTSTIDSGGTTYSQNGQACIVADVTNSAYHVVGATGFLNSVTAFGSGLSVSGSTLNVAAGGVTNAMLAGGITPSNLASQAAQTILGNATSGSAVPTATYTAATTDPLIPTESGTFVSGNCTKYSGTAGKIIDAGAPCGSGTPGGSTTQLQYNNAGSFGGTSGCTATSTVVSCTSPVFTTPTLGTVASGSVLTNATGLPVSTGISGLGTGIATALASNPSGTGAVCLATGSACAGSSSGGGFFGYSDNGVTVTANTYFAPANGGGAPQTTESAVSVPAPAATTVSKLSVSINATLGAASTGFTVTLRQNGSDTALTCTFNPSAATACVDNTHSVNLTAADVISWKIVTAGTIVGTPTITISSANGTSNVGVTSVTVTVPSRQTATGCAITTSGTCAISDNTQNKNIIFSGPASGSAAAPTFRSLVANDIPTLSQVAVVAGRWYQSPLYGPAGTTAGTGAGNVIFWTPIYFDKAMTLGALGSRLVATSASGNMQWAVYASDPTTFFPTGAPLGSTTSASTTTAAAISGTLTAVIPGPGIYWFGKNQDNATATTIGGNVNSINAGALVGGSSEASIFPNSSQVNLTWTTAQTFGTWPTSPTLTEVVGGNPPEVGYEVSSVP